MSQETIDTSLDALRDLDEADGEERLDAEGTYHVILSSVYEVRARDESDAREKFMNDEAAFVGDDITNVKQVDD